MPFQVSAFRQLLKPLDRRVVSRFVDEHRGNHGVGTGDGAWTCERHLRALLFGQLAGLTSLREIVEGLSARPGGLYHAGACMARRSTLSDASKARPASVFRDIAQHLMGLLTRELRQEGADLIRLIDGSPIPIRDGRFSWAQADSRVRGLRLHLAYDPRAVHPVHFALETPKISELKVARGLTVEAGATYVFDKGYTDYGWWRHLVDGGARFVTRLKNNVCRRDIQPRAFSGDGILNDQTLKVGHKKPRGGANNPLYDMVLREVVVERPGKEPLYLVTNDFQRNATEIADLYKERWQIELFFKWIKQNLKIKAFHGRSENAVRIQIYVAIIAFCLLRLFQKTFALSHKGGTKAILTRLKVAIFSPFDLTGKAPSLPKPPQSRMHNPQLTFNLKA